MHSPKSQARLKKKIGELQAALARLQGEHADCRRVIVSLKERNAMLEAYVGPRHQQRQHLQMINSGQDDASSPNSREAYLVKENDFLLKQLDSLISSKPDAQQAQKVDASSDAASFHSASLDCAGFSSATDTGCQTDASDEAALAAMTKQIGQLLEELKASRVKEDQLHQRLVSCEERVVFLRDEKKEIQKRADKYLDEKLEKVEAMEAAKLEVKELKQAGEKQASDLSQAKLECEQLRAELTDSQRQLAGLRDSLANQRAASEKQGKAEEEAKQLRQKLRESERARAKCEQEVKELDVKLSRALGDKDVLSQELGSVRAGFSKLERQQQDGSSAAATLRTQLAEERRRVGSFELAQSAAQDLLRNLQEELAEVREQLQSQKSAYEQQQRKDREELQRLRHKAQAADDQLKVLQRRATEERAHYDQLMARCNKQQSELQSERASAGKYSCELARTSERQLQLESELRNCQRRYEEAMAESQLKIYKLEQTCNQHIKLIDYLRPFEEQLANCKCKAKKVVRVKGQWSSAFSTPLKSSTSDDPRSHQASLYTPQPSSSAKAVGLRYTTDSLVSNQ